MPATPETCTTCGEPLFGSQLAGGHCSRCLFKITFADDTPPPPEDDSTPWTRISGCELYEELGRGGMGVVYRAKQQALDRIVAVKVLLRAQFAGKQERERFHREAQAAARLKHPGIVGIIDVGENDGVPWFSMEYIAGQSLEQLVREHPMDAHEAARCVKQVAEALQHAHDHGVLHRDLKPSNILLDLDGTPRITDFGIARIGTTGTAGAELTRTGQMLGSPGYAAPEQALTGKAEVRTDVYGLGALLYHLLTGRPPFQGPTLDAILMQLRESDPLSPRKLNPTVPRDLETICLKCLHKAPEGRYITAAATAEDLGRFLDGDAIRARPLSPLGALWRWTRRHPGIAALLTIIVLLITSLIGGSLAFARHQQQLERRSSLLSEARSLRQRHVAGSRTDALAALDSAWAIAPSSEIRNEVIACLALPEIGAPQLVDQNQTTAPDPTRSGDGRRIAAIVGHDLIVTEIATQKQLAQLSGFQPGSLLKLDDHGRRIAVAEAKGKLLQLIDLADGRVIATCQHNGTLSSVDWSGDLIATGCDNRFIYIWDTAGTMLHRLSGHEAEPIRVSFRPRSQELMSTSSDVHVRLWHAARGVEILRRDLPHAPHTAIWWNPAGTAFHALTDAGHEELYPVTPSTVFQLLAPPGEEPHTENFGSAAVSADGEVAAVVDEASWRVWDFRGGRLAAQFVGSPSQWRSAQFSSGPPPLLWTCGWDEELSNRSLTRDAHDDLIMGEKTPRMSGHGQILRSVSPDGRAIVMSNNSSGKFIVYRPEDAQTLRIAHPGNLAALLSHDQTWILTSSYQSNGAKIWRLPDGKLQRTLCRDDTITNAILSPDGQRLLLNSGKHGYAFRTSDWTEQALPPGDLQLESMTYSPDGRYLATVADDHIRLRDPITFADVMRLTLPGHVGWLGQAHLLFDANGTHLLLHTALGSVARWDLQALDDELRKHGMAR